MKLFFLSFLISLQIHALSDSKRVLAPGPKISKASFEDVVSLLTITFQPLAKAEGRSLVFLTDYDDDWAQAFARRWESDQVIVYGGMAGLKGGSADSLALVLCHELGHLYGGWPYQDEPNRLSVEGQADYFATFSCFQQIVSKLPRRSASQDNLKRCGQDDGCARALDAAQVLGNFYADNRSLKHPSFLTPDGSRVSTTLMTHPSPQCRLDTMLAGVLGYGPPTCWFRR